jgi:hypothetical protein
VREWAHQAAAAHAERLLAGGAADDVGAAKDLQGERQELRCRVRLQDQPHHALLILTAIGDTTVEPAFVCYPFPVSIFFDSLEVHTVGKKKERMSSLVATQNLYMNRGFW